MNNETEQIFLLNSAESRSTASQKINETPETTPVNLENVDDFSNVCRTCATITQFVIPIFDGEGLQNNLADKIHKHLPIQVSERDVLPRVVCYQCASTLLAWHELVQCCVQADTALRTRLAVNADLAEQRQLASSKEPTQNLDKEQQTKFKEIADFVVRTMEPPRYVDGATSPAAGPSRRCDFCRTEHPERAYDEHLVAEHADLLFHCDECNTYVDRKEFLLHMSIHAVQYANERDRKREPDKKIKKIKKEVKVEDENDERNVPRERVAKRVQKKEKRERGERASAASGVGEARRNEFSDESDAEGRFGPLPKSVFEAIEDSGDGRPADEGDAPAEAAGSSGERASDDDDEGSAARSTGSSQKRRPRKQRSPRKTLTPKENAAERRKRPRTCPICSKVYTAASSYFYHVRHVHGRRKEHACGECGKAFGTRGGLAQHASVHSAERRLACARCGKRFRARASLYIHEQTHSGDARARRWPCPHQHCGRAFRWRTHLARHAKRHAAERAYACDACPRAFSVHCDLLRHRRTHAARPGGFACDTCGAKFAQPRYLKVHVGRKHPPQAAATATATATTATTAAAAEPAPGHSAPKKEIAKAE